MRKGAKIAIWVVGAIVVIGGISDLTGANKTPPGPSKAQIAAQAKETAQTAAKAKKRQQDEVKTYIATALDKDSNMQIEISAVGDKIKGESRTQAYSDVMPIKDLADTYQTFFGTNDQAPSDLPAKVKSALNDAADNLSTCMYSYEKGLGDVLDYLDTGKPSDVSDEQTQFGYANTAEGVANADFRKARAGVGLK